MFREYTNNKLNLITFCSLKVPDKYEICEVMLLLLKSVNNNEINNERLNVITNNNYLSIKELREFASNLFWAHIDTKVKLQPTAHARYVTSFGGVSNPNNKDWQVIAKCVYEYLKNNA